MFGVLFNKKTKLEQKFLEDKILKNKCRLALFGDGVFLEKTFEYLSSKKIIQEAFCTIEQKSNLLNNKKIRKDLDFLKSKKHLKVCRYCHIENMKMKSAKPAEQIKH